MASIFKIRHKKTGLFSKGGWDAKYHDSYSWSKAGKVWRGLGPLRIHLNLFLEDNSHVLNEWEVIEYEMTEKETKSAVDMLHPQKILDLVAK